MRLLLPIRRRIRIRPPNPSYPAEAEAGGNRIFAMTTVEDFHRGEW
jgi:hypothetical protein